VRIKGLPHALHLTKNRNLFDNDTSVVILGEVDAVHLFAGAIAYALFI
jgi:hypothetical protein